jgi:hypothetical protein
MFADSETRPPPKQRRSPRFPFDSLLRVTLFPLAEGIGLWARSIDLCREGIGLTVAAELTAEELVAVEIPLAADKPVTVRASVRYCNQGRCGFEFVNLDEPQREAIQAACKKLSKTSGHS